MNVLVHHGTNAEYGVLAKGSWVTQDKAVAAEFAREKAGQEGGQPCILTLEIDELEIDWDVAAQVSGVHDSRGTIRHDMQVLWREAIPHPTPAP